MIYLAEMGVNLGRCRVWKTLLDIGTEDAIPRDLNPHTSVKEPREDLFITNFRTPRREEWRNSVRTSR
jgi:hypothetical protein